MPGVTEKQLGGLLQRHEAIWCHLLPCSRSIVSGAGVVMVLLSDV